MILSNIRYWWICVLLCMICTVSRGNETQKADSLFAAGNFGYAGLEYERIVFFSNDERLKDNCLLKKGYCHKALGEYSDASRTFSRINKSGKSDSLIFISRYESALCAFLAGDYSYAEAELGRMKTEVMDSLLAQNALYLEVIILTEEEKWELAKNQYQIYCKKRGIDTTAFHLISNENELDLKNEKKAKILSMLLPGLGQTYAGKPWRGLSSLVLTGAAVAYGVYSFSQNLFITTLFTGLTFTMRFYTGGTKYALRTVREYNIKQKNAYKKSVKEMILSTEGKF